MLWPCHAWGVPPLVGSVPGSADAGVNTLRDAVSAAEAVYDGHVAR
jgi:hypothetical protein